MGPPLYRTSPSLRCALPGLIVALAGLWTISSAQGQIQDAGLWLGAFSQGEFSAPALRDRDARWWFDANTRFLGESYPLLQSVIRPGIGRQLNDEQSIWVGYAWIGESIPGIDFHENRIWEQWSLTQDYGDTTVLFRSRLEQRFVSVGNDAGWRFRQMIRLQRPFRGHDKLMWVAWDEIFFHLNNTDWGARAGYNQNRVFVGIGREPRLTGRRRTEIGYLYQQINVPEDGADLSNHILSVNIFLNR
jgi:hypothetical protein